MAAGGAFAALSFASVDKSNSVPSLDISVFASGLSVTPESVLGGAGAQAPMPADRKEIVTDSYRPPLWRRRVEHCRSHRDRIVSVEPWGHV
ncbi:hypothetical protein BH92_12865 [Rhodococcoides fascians A21d2]|uniref:hypothetical protein n=1 Tax=Nocardiaceae TaxID=85025 RepID=UPI0005660A17|nr:MULTISPECIES: hypothetical protein [Rhodococcus]QII00654.1 hypothetical protein BH92_12865 [Rhodococcus fascians A21d2]